VKRDVALVIDYGFKEVKKVLIICIDEDSNQYLRMVASHFDPSIQVDTHCLKDRPPVENEYLQYDLLVTGVECYRTQRQNNEPWTLGPVSVVIFSQYEY
jgi:hypothetical protein